MRVALVGPYPLDAGRVAGGVQTSFLNLLRGLEDLDGLELHVITFSTALGSPSRRQIDGFDVHVLPGTQRLANATLHARERRLLGRTLAQLRPDVVHAQDALRYGYVSLRAAPDVPVVVSVHGVVREELRFARGLRARAQMRIAGVALQRHVVRAARYVVAPTRYALDYFGDDLRGRFWAIDNPIEDAFFGVEPTPRSGALLYAGALTPGKRVHDLIAALPAVVEAAPDVSLRIVGVAPHPTYGDELREQVTVLGVGSHVTFVGALPYDELPREYAQAAVLVLPSGQEASPMVIGEAMAVGAPVVATAVGGVRYLVDQGRTGFLVEAGDVPALSARLVELLEDDDKRAAFGATARKCAESRFRPRAVAERVRAVYETVIELERAQSGS